MGTTVKIKESTWTDVPPDEYLVRVKDVDTLDLEFGRTAKLKFEVVRGIETEDEYQGQTVEGLASFPPDGISERSKLFGWASTILGQSLAEVKEFDLEDLIDKRCRIIVKTKKRDDGTEKTVVESVLAAPKKKQQPPKPQTEDDADDLAF